MLIRLYWMASDQRSVWTFFFFCETTSFEKWINSNVWKISLRNDIDFAHTKFVTSYIVRSYIVLRGLCIRILFFWRFIPKNVLFQHYHLQIQNLEKLNDWFPLIRRLFQNESFFKEIEKKNSSQLTKSNEFTILKKKY